jgi:hypothetical protein
LVAIFFAHAVYKFGITQIQLRLQLLPNRRPAHARPDVVNISLNCRLRMMAKL